MKFYQDLDATNNMIEVAKIFKSNDYELFIVGGFVRDKLLNLTPYDIDICSQVSLKDVEKILKNSSYAFEVINQKFGTARIRKENEIYEYTVFRKETYPLDGNHYPNSITFSSSIYEDVKRRDFYINAIYYDPLSYLVVAPFNKSIENIKNRVIEVLPHEQNTFCEDSARILRLIKFSVMLDLKIERNTFIFAKNNYYLLEKLSKSRRTKEMSFTSLLSNDKKKKLENLLLELSSKNIN